MCNCEADASGAPPELDELEAARLIRRVKDRIEVTDEAKPLVRTVTAAFDAYLNAGAATHATAV